ncbi:phosphotransferase family protein [Mycoplasmopsis synoviae]|uniref:phosphotransferase family protein n=1 Tax=Mycoplasmopsis synoviae TaxID=2109 RepID=UPI000CA1A5E0|nr:phosphotransferase [Mycoplasmopsis synoviae]AKJ20501.1 Choline kinase family [Mycoplasmopsis synoviae]AQU47814.1 Choline kinase family [Mycoplasmopsis synoviae]AWL84076.1 hypothetical protein MSH_01415 [Mycoplasmopsis synoviae]QLE13797.1 hypothetical protein DEH79_01415 [Mycoplasmopsis synoviae]UZF64572.1 phosphotransferase [Mycoplasmopsis synoviae]
MQKEKISVGYTNTSYKQGDLFIQEKTYNGMNHQLNLDELRNLDFVPELISHNHEQTVWKWIESKPLVLTDENIKKIAINFKKLHDSKCEFPKNNIAQRIKNYLKILSEKNINIKEVNDFYNKVNLVLSNMDKSTPLHNDIYQSNLIWGKDDKIYFVDWEYATMGDKHFDLAFFICAGHLDQRQEELLLKTYGNYSEEYLLQHKVVIFYLIILWVNAQKVKHFDDKPYIEKMLKVEEKFQQRKAQNFS